MEHKDFLGLYLSIKNDEVRTLNKLLNAYFNGEYHFENQAAKPFVVATLANVDMPVSAKVMAVKAPVTLDSGILVCPEDYEGTVEIGMDEISFGDIDGIIDCLPEPIKSYTFCLDGGNLPRRHETFKFKCDADAMMASRGFMKCHHIDVINVFEGKDADRRYVVSYSKDGNAPD